MRLIQLPAASAISFVRADSVPCSGTDPPSLYSYTPKTLCEVLTVADAIPPSVAGPRVDGSLSRHSIYYSNSKGLCVWYQTAGKICVADARLRKGVYTPKGVRGVYTYTGSHSKTIVFGLITLDGEGFFQRYDSFTGKEFVEFLKAACERFGKILMITDGAPQHRSKFVREEIGRLDGDCASGYCASIMLCFIRESHCGRLESLFLSSSGHNLSTFTSKNSNS